MPKDLRRNGNAHPVVEQVRLDIQDTVHRFFDGKVEDIGTRFRQDAFQDPVIGQGHQLSLMGDLEIRLPSLRVRAVVVPPACRADGMGSRRLW